MSNGNVFDKAPAESGNPAQAMNAGKKGSAPEKKGLTGKHVALILGALVIVAAAVVIVFLLRPVPEEIALAETNPPTGARLITEANVLEIGREIEERVARGMFETHMNVDWSFPDGRSPSSNAVMGNSINNNFPFYFTVTLSDTGEVVFTSGLLPLGTEIAEIVLDTPLSAGTYNAVVNVHMIDDDGEPVDSNMGFNITLSIAA